VKRRTMPRGMGVALSVRSYLMHCLSLGVNMTTDSQSIHMPEIGFESILLDVDGNTVFFRRYGRGPAILMIHGFPRTSLMWRHLDRNWLRITR